MDQLTITALNLSRTAYASFALDARSFFIDYEFGGSSATKGGDRFTCQLLNKVCLSHRHERSVIDTIVGIAVSVQGSSKRCTGPRKRD